MSNDLPKQVSDLKRDIHAQMADYPRGPITPVWVSKLPFVGDWLELHSAERQSRILDEKYKNILGEYYKPSDDLTAVQTIYQDQEEVIWERIRNRNTRKLITRAIKYGVQVPRKPPQPDEYGDENWYFSFPTNSW